MIRNVLCLHGMGQTKRSLKTILTHIERNTTANFHYLEAPYKMPGCPGFRWFDRDANFQAKNEQISCSIDLIRAYSLQYGIDTLFGFSQGGMMVNLALMFSPDVLQSVDRAIIMSGYRQPSGMSDLEVTKMPKLPVTLLNINSIAETYQNPLPVGGYQCLEEVTHNKGHKIVINQDIKQRVHMLLDK